MAKNPEHHKQMAAAAQWVITHGAESAQETEPEVFRNSFFQDSVTMIDSGAKDIDKFISVRPGQIEASTGKMKLYSAINEPNARLYVVIAGRELYDEYAADKRKRGSNPSISRANIMSELRAQKGSWIPAPKPPAARQYGFGIPNEKNSSREWWIMDYQRLGSELKAIFAPIYESELARVNLTVEDDTQELLICPV